eukprot:scaffold1924_cov119-Skeletonema_marinoi.AAC.1
MGGKRAAESSSSRGKRMKVVPPSPGAFPEHQNRMSLQHLHTRTATRIRWRSRGSKAKAKGSKTDILKPGDVLILLTGKFLFGLQGGLLAVEGRGSRTFSEIP